MSAFTILMITTFCIGMIMFIVEDIVLGYVKRIYHIDIETNYNLVTLWCTVMGFFGAIIGFILFDGALS